MKYETIHDMAAGAATVAECEAARLKIEGRKATVTAVLEAALAPAAVLPLTAAQIAGRRADLKDAGEELSDLADLSAALDVKLAELRIAEGFADLLRRCQAVSTMRARNAAFVRDHLAGHMDAICNFLDADREAYVAWIAVTRDINGSGLTDAQRSALPPMGMGYDSVASRPAFEQFHLTALIHPEDLDPRRFHHVDRRGDTHLVHIGEIDADALARMRKPSEVALSRPLTDQEIARLDRRGVENRIPGTPAPLARFEQ